MKGLFPPNPRSGTDLKAVGNGSSSEQPQPQQQPLVLESNGHLDADVSMDDSHASAMSGVTTESMTIGSPPRTQRKKRNSNGFRSILAGPPPQAAHGGVSVRSRLFPEDADLKPPSRDNNNNHPSLILKPFDLNQQFANSADPPFNNNSSSPNSPAGRQPSALTPFRRRPDGQGALRKRHADQDDLYGRDWICDAQDDAFSATESPVDMYTSPRISPSKSAKHRTTMHRSPFYSSKPKSQSQQLQYTKSPSHFQTLDGRTVQSKNPFSPMVFDDTPTPTPGRPVHSPTADPATALGLTHPLLLTSDSLSESTSSAGGKSHFLLSHKLQKRRTSPSHNNSDNTARGSSARMGIGIDGLTRGLGVNNTDKQKLEQKTSKYIRDGYPEPTGQYSFTGSPIKENFATTTTSTQSNFTTKAPSLASKPAATVQNPTVLFGSAKGSETSEDYCTNIHKVRRKSKGDDVVAAAAQGESSWKKEMYINTTNTNNEGPSFLNFDNNNGSGLYNTIPNKSYFYNQQKKNQKEDSISPTDVFNFPQFRASPSDTSTLPPAPSKPVRRPPIRRYTPIRKTTGPPPTPMPGARQPRTFGLEDINKNNNNNIFGEIGGDSSGDESGSDRVGGIRRRRRRPKSDASMGSALPPSRFYSDFDVIAELGSGSFGNVYKVLSRLDGCFYAIKVANRVAKGIADKDRMLKEVYALAALSDRADTATFHIVRYHQAWMEDERLYIQTELCTTTLQAEMKLVAPGQLPLATRFKCLREILLALNFIHNNQMVHLDIKPENIFLKNDQFKLGDFGLVSKVSSHDVEEGDSRYMSMELLSGDHADLTKSDIFSLGIAMYELCLGSNKNLPSNGADWQALRSGRILPPSNTSDELFQIIKQMMNPTYSERPSASDLLKLPDLMSAEQKMMARERERLLQANQALAARSLPALPKPKGLVRRNTWSAF